MYPFCSILARHIKLLKNMNYPYLFFFCFVSKPQNLSPDAIAANAPETPGRFGRSSVTQPRAGLIGAQA
jgi:hypothetical protein